MLPVIFHRLGDTFSWAGVVTLPGTSTWAVECGLRNPLTKFAPPAPDFIIPATLTLIAANAKNAAMNDYTLLLAEDGPTTATWAQPDQLSAPASMLAAVKFYDTETPSIQITTQPFVINLGFNLVPRA